MAVRGSSIEGSGRHGGETTRIHQGDGVARAVLAGTFWSVLECSDLLGSGTVAFVSPGRTPLFLATHLAIGIAACLLLFMMFDVGSVVLAALLRRLMRQPDSAPRVAAGLVMYSFALLVWLALCQTVIVPGGYRLTGMAVGPVLCAPAYLLGRQLMGVHPGHSRGRDGLWLVVCLTLVIAVHLLNREVLAKQYFPVHVACTLFALIAGLFGAGYATRLLRRGSGHAARGTTRMAITVTAGVVLSATVLFGQSNDVRDALFNKAMDARGLVYLARKLSPLERDLAHAQLPRRAFTIPAPATRRVDRVLLVTIDTLRADHLVAYGYHRETTPTLTAFARRAATFDWAYSSGAVTTIALHALFGEDGVEEQLLRGTGVLRTAVVSRYMIEILGPSWMADAFDRIVETPESDDQVVEATTREIREGRFRGLLWVHLMAPHEPYESRHFGNKAVDRYDGDILEADRSLARLLAAVEQDAHANRTAVVIASDHGEEFGEHGGQFHGLDVHEELIRIPLVIRVPGLAPRRVDESVGLADVGPTISDLLGAPASYRAGRRSLVPLLMGERLAGEAPVLVGPLGSFDTGAVMLGRRKLTYSLFNQSAALYDLTSDPGERRNMFEVQPEIARQVIESVDDQSPLAGPLRALWRRAQPTGLPRLSP
jgi:hypothetical protein